MLYVVQVTGTNEESKTGSAFYVAGENDIYCAYQCLPLGHNMNVDCLQTVQVIDQVSNILLYCVLPVIIVLNMACLALS